jgi:nicotinamide mononucleotide transporter
MIESTLLGFHVLEWLALIFNALYTYFAAKSNIWCWPLGFLGSLFTLLLCLQVGLLAESGLQVFYMLLAIWGFYSWRKMSELDSRNTPIQRMSLFLHIRILVGGVVLSILLGKAMSSLGAALPYWDSLTTTFSILATILIARRFLENWIYWIAIDLLSVGLYASRELYLLSFLFIVYTLLAIYGWRRWQIEWTQNGKINTIKLD